MYIAGNILSCKFYLLERMILRISLLKKIKTSNIGQTVVIPCPLSTTIPLKYIKIT